MEVIAAIKTYVNIPQKNHFIRFFTFLVWCIIAPDISAQCTTSAAIVIPDPGTTTFQFTISGLIDGDLSSPTQGICGIEIDFMHEYLGDLTISLISPSGTRVDLIGPVTTAIPVTNLSHWNVDFVPCGMPANPDPGFATTWSNLQPWQALTNYSGTYHPHSGCLENFNTGPANGIWEVIIQDHDQFQSGTIARITLIFCNPIGLNCMECNPNAGLLSPAMFTICSGESIQSSGIAIDFGGNMPSPSLYSYEFLLVSGNTILQNGSAFSATPPPGSYQICGLSYLKADTTAINTLLDSEDIDLLALALDNDLVCGELTSSCISVEVLSRPDTVVVFGDLCNGEMYSFGGQSYINPGVYYQAHDGPGLCDTVFEVRVFARELTVHIAPPDTLSCGAGTILLTSSATGASGPFIYQWTTPSGHILSAPNASSITVDQAAWYMLSVTDGVCSGVASVYVPAHQGFPQILVEGGTLSCTQPEVDLQPIYIPSDGLIQWTGPMGFISDQSHITVDVPGTYVFQVTNSAGCTTSRPVEISADTLTMDFEIYPIDKNCQNNILIVGNTFSEFMMHWEWTGPNSFVSNLGQPGISDAGLYILNATFRNGCTRSSTFFFDGDFVIPDMVVSPPDTLHCNDTLTLMVTTTTPGVTYGWVGPQEFYSPQPVIQVTQIGTYIAFVFAPNGCSNVLSTTISQGDDIFEFEFFTDTITCHTDSVFIGINSTEADLFEWLNYSGNDQGQAMIKVGMAGLYSVMVTDTHTGCSIIQDIRVVEDLRLPDFAYTAVPATCLNSEATLSFDPNPGFIYSGMYWQLPDMSIVFGPTISSSSPEMHLLFAIGENGCIGVRNVFIPYDTLPPVLLIESDTLTCNDTLTLRFQSLETITSHQWSGPGILSTGLQDADVNQAGWYQLTVVGENGCPGIHDIMVDSNFIVPEIMLLADTLSCDEDASIRVITNDIILTYAWFDGGGLFLTSDSILMPDQPGVYSVLVEGDNHCLARDTVTIDDLIFPNLMLYSETLSCENPLVVIRVEVDMAPVDIVWYDAAGVDLGTDSILHVTSGGPFIVSVTSDHGCEIRDTITVPIDTIRPLAHIELLGEVRCNNREVILDGSMSSPGNVEFLWSADGGMILDDPTLPVVTVRDPGLYILWVRNPDNGCRDTLSFHLSDATEVPGPVTLLVIPPQCQGDVNGSVEITAIEGGLEPFQFQLFGGIPQLHPLFEGLGDGNFILTITDAEGCRMDTTFTIEAPVPYSVDAGPDVEINLGESISLHGTTDLPMAEFMSDQWSFQSQALCVDCPSLEVNPLETTTYSYQVKNVYGCVQADHVTVYVTQKGHHYIPSIFSPNGDNINDELRIHPSVAIARVIRWVIFDRWGSAVYGRTDFVPDDPSVFWDGRTTTGGTANPGVFPYMLEIQLINGKIEIYRGDITLIR